jgi:hypothetical protein
MTVSTGQTYDRTSIKSLVAMGNTTCPLPRHPRAARGLHPAPAHPGVLRRAHPHAQAARRPGLRPLPHHAGPVLPTLHRLIMATQETRSALVKLVFASACEQEEAVMVLALVELSEAEAAEVVGRERVTRLSKAHRRLQTC